MKKFYHWLDMKLTHSTTYDNKPFGLVRLLKKIGRHWILPFKTKGWFGFCDECGKFRKNLVKEIIDTEVDSDQDGIYTIPISGMICNNCQLDVEAEMER